MGNKNNAVSYMQGASVPAKDDPIRQRVKMLNEGVIQPGQGDPAFALRMQDALAKERANELALEQQNEMARNQFMASLPDGTNAARDMYSGPAPGTSVQNWLTTLSQRSPQGKLQIQLNQLNDAELRNRLQWLQNNPTPSEMSLPGTGAKGHFQNMFNWLIGRPNAL